VLYLHLAAEAIQNHTTSTPGTTCLTDLTGAGCGVARVEDPVAGGPVSLEQLKVWLRHDRVTVQPVLDPTEAAPVDGYEIPHHLREAVRLLTPYETFPWGTTPTTQADLDHVVPYVPADHGGPPGQTGHAPQTGLTNLGPLGRTHHLAKTFDGFTVHQHGIGSYRWRTPTGYWYQVDHHGTRPLGRDPADTADTADAARPAPLSLSENHFHDLITQHLAA
jgi:hypothetical protein